MELSTRQRTSIFQSYCSNECDYKMIWFTVDNSSCFFIGNNTKTVFNPNTVIVSSLFNNTVSAVDISYRIEESDSIDLLFSEKINKIINTLSISKKKMCDILSITRPTLYSWLDNIDIQPESKNYKNVSSLFDIINSLKIQTPIYHMFIEEYMTGEQTSILEQLKKTETIKKDNKEILRLLKKACELTVERNQQIQHSLNGLDSISVNHQELLMEDNINSL